MMEIETIIARQYTPKESQPAMARLSAAEVGVLEEVAAQLGWPSITSLATKYFPACPFHDRWPTALRRMLQHSKRGNIRYLLKVLQSIGEELEGKAYSGRKSLNRVTNRLERDIQKKDLSLSRLQSIRESAKAQNKRAMGGPLGQRVLAQMGAAC